MLYTFPETRCLAGLSGPENKNVRLRIAQVEAHLPEEFAYRHITCFGEIEKHKNQSSTICTTSPQFIRSNYRLFKTIDEALSDSDGVRINCGESKG